MGQGASRLLIDEQPRQGLVSLAKAIGLEESVFVDYSLKASKHKEGYLTLEISLFHSAEVVR